MSRLTVNLFKDILKPEQLDLLTQSNIVTSLQFVKTSSEKLGGILSINVKEVLVLKKKILSFYRVKATKGHRLYQKALKLKSIHETGSPEVDTRIGGGLLSGSITEVYGDPGSGKTMFAIQCTAKSAVSTTRRLLYLSTSAFHVETLLGFLRQMTAVEDEITHALRRIHVVHLKEVQDLLDILHSPEIKNYSFIVVDSLAILFLPLPSGSSNYRISLLAETGSILKRIAKTHQMVVLVINHISSSGQTSSSSARPALGRYWQHVPTLRFLMEKKDDSTYRLTIQKNAYGLSGATHELRLYP